MSKRLKTSTDTAKRRDGQKTRTDVACDYCRKQKTRCFKSTESPSCLRCICLKRPCLLDQGVDTSGIPASLAEPLTNGKLDLLQKSVNEVLKFLKGKGYTPETMDSPSMVNNNSSKNSSTNLADNGPNYSSLPYVKHRRLVAEDAYFQSPANSFSISPFSVIANQIPRFNIPNPILNLLGMDIPKPPVASEPSSLLPHIDIKHTSPPVDAISAGIITEAEAIDLMDDFRRNFGRWILLPINMSLYVLIDKLRYKLSLLLTVCYCLSSRFSLNGITDSKLLEEKTQLHRRFLKQLVKDLSKALLKYTCFSGGAAEGYIEFLQALVLLSIYSLSLSSMCRSAFEGVIGDSVAQGFNDHLEFESEFEPILKLDPWNLSAFGINIFVTRCTMGTLLQNSGNVNAPFTVFQDELDSEDFQMLAVLRTYNHLTLVHIINCVFSGRMCVIDPIRLRYCTATLNLPSSTNFDGRMVSEIGILLICYNYVQGVLNEPLDCQTLEICNENYRHVRGEVDAWYKQWSYIFNQPAPQFVEPCYHFCNLVINFSYVFQKALLIDGRMDTSAFISKPKEINLFNEDSVSYIINHSDASTLREIKLHAIMTVRFVNIIESDSYFAYLLDQVHFCFFFAGIVLLKILKSEQLKQNSLTTAELSEVKRDIKLLILKFAMMSTSINSPDDMTTRYCRGLGECFNDVYK